MRLETRTVRVGEWLGDVPEDWDYEGFFKKYLQHRESFERGVALYKQMASAIKRGAKVWATVSGDFTHEVYSCGLYDGWVFWEPRPCYLFKGPIGTDRGEFYDLMYIRVEEPLSAATSERPA